MIVGTFAAQAAKSKRRQVLREMPVATSFEHPLDQLQKLSKNKKQLWVVGYVNGTLEESLQDLEVSFQNGADAIVFEGAVYDKLDATLTEVRKRYPHHVIGVNYLGAVHVAESYVETFELAQKHGLQIAWTDFSGVDLINEDAVPNLQMIDAAKPKNVFYVSGIHMKYSTLVDPNKTIEKSAMQAMGWVDGIVITGPRTGVPMDPLRARAARSVIGKYPLGAASGVSAENVETILPEIDFVLVNSSISDEHHRILGDKVQALRQAMDRVQFHK